MAVEVCGSVVLGVLLPLGVEEYKGEPLAEELALCVGVGELVTSCEELALCVGVDEIDALGVDLVLIVGVNEVKPFGLELEL